MKNCVVQKTSLDLIKLRMFVDFYTFFIPKMLIIVQNIFDLILYFLNKNKDLLRALLTNYTDLCMFKRKLNN